MPEYLSPGVYVEETSFRSKSIEGVSTTTTGFVGPCRYGPVDQGGEITTSLVEFERVYGDGADLAPDGAPRRNYLWHAVRAFFAEGGRRVYVSRIFRRTDDAATVDVNESVGAFRGPDANDHTAVRATGGVNYLDGYARGFFDGSPGTTRISIRARHPGAYGNFRVRVQVRLGQNILGGTAAAPRIQGALTHGDVVSVIARRTTPTALVALYRASLDPATGLWSFVNAGGTATALASVSPVDYSLQVVTAAVLVAPVSDPSREEVWSGLSFGATHTSLGSPDALTVLLGEDPNNLSLTRAVPIVVRALDYSPVAPAPPVALTDGLAILSILTTGTDGARVAAFLASNVLGGTGGNTDTREVVLTGGNDGVAPGVADYEGAVNPATDRKTGLRKFEDIEDISIVAAPGATFGSSEDEAVALSGALIAHCRAMRYRIAVLDPVNNRSVGDVRAFRARLDSSHAAVYYPWVRVVDPNTRQPIHLPPSGFVAGIYARNDTERAVYKAPANEVVNLAIGFETALGKGHQDVLNPEGVNCFRFFEGRGYRLWGARTASSDPEWKYVNLRRYFAYLERSIERGTQWAVFEPNGQQLWGNVRRTIEDFLFNEFQSGALLGDRPDSAYFVKCDRTTMTQNDLDNGRLVCLIGVAVVKPAEFVIFRIGQWTGDRKA